MLSPLPPTYCRAMFMSGLSESKQTHVHLRNVDPATLQIIITYAYTGNLAISDSTVEPLYETACFLQVSSQHLSSVLLRRLTERPLPPLRPKKSERRIYVKAD